jgi:hypothetical protein
MMAMDWHDTLMGSVLVISSGLTFAYITAGSRNLLRLTLIGAAATFVIGVLLSFLLPEVLHPSSVRDFHVSWLRVPLSEGQRQERADLSGS